MARFGVMRQQPVLEEARVIAMRKVGREKMHYLNPVPTQFIFNRWINKNSLPRKGE